MRIGFGYDVHRLAAGRPLVLGGIRIPHTAGLAGHSDADVLLHAVIDAMLGAAAMGDIGAHFPDTDDRYRDADSAGLLVAAGTLLAREGFRVVNIDSTVVAEAPKLRPYVDRMRERIADLLDLSSGCVSVKATTSEGMGFAGRGEGMAAYAVCMIAAVEGSERG
jgi:2-C-methyl-D-erythritol 2,4-cyclodiphosphate synthase